MKQIVDLGKKIEDDERKEFILNMITGLLFLIPFVGETVGPELVAIRLMTRLIGTIGNGALTMYGIVNNPDSAFSQIFFFLVGEVLNLQSMRGAANARRGMNPSELERFGAVKVNLDKIGKIRDRAIYSL